MPPINIAEAEAWMPEPPSRMRGVLIGGGHATGEEWFQNNVRAESGFRAASAAGPDNGSGLTALRTSCMVQERG